jgi:hypothetical protein
MKTVAELLVEALVSGCKGLVIDSGMSFSS